MKKYMISPFVVIYRNDHGTVVRQAELGVVYEIGEETHILLNNLFDARTSIDLFNILNGDPRMKPSEFDDAVNTVFELEEMLVQLMEIGLIICFEDTVDATSE